MPLRVRNVPKMLRKKRCDHQYDIPHLQHPALFLDHHGMQEGSPREPGQKRGVLDRVPTPVAAPAEHGVSPIAAQKNSETEEHPGDHGPTARGANPVVTKLPRDQRRHGKGEWDHHTDVAQVKHRRVNHHRVVLQKRIQPVAVRRAEGLHPRGRSEREFLKRVGNEKHQRRKEDAGAHQHGNNVRHKLAVLRAVQQDCQGAVNRKQPRPEKQRPFLPCPQRRHFVICEKVAVGVLGNVGVVKVVGVDQVFEGEDSQRDHRRRKQARRAQRSS